MIATSLTVNSRFIKKTDNDVTGIADWKTLPEENKVLLPRLINEAFNGHNLWLLEEVLHPHFVNHQEVSALYQFKMVNSLSGGG